MIFQNFWRFAVTAFLCPVIHLLAQVPPAEHLLPEETIGVLTIPDWQKLNAFQGETAWGKLWADPAMKPFRDNFISNFSKDVLQPLELELGLKLSEYQELLQGQVTLAFTPPTEGTKHSVGLLLLIEAKEKTDFLATNLTALRKKWSESGKEVKTEKIREVDFSTITISGKDIDTLLQKVFPGPPPEDEEDEEEKKEPEKIELRIGQSKSLLVIGENPKIIEKILAKQNGGLVTPLADQASFTKSQRLLFRDSLGFAWLNFKPIYQKWVESSSARQPTEEAPPGMSFPQMEKILPALGFDRLESLSAKISGGDGTHFEFLVAVPEGQREGLFKILAFEKKDTAPPLFVPSDAIKFQRWRIDSQKAWATLEQMISKIQPSLLGIIQLMISSAGKDKDPNFDLKKNLIGNLGDDFITFEKKPKTDKAENIQSPPSLILIGSPNPNELLDAMRVLVSLAPPPLSTAPVQEREFLGRKIYSITGTMPATPTDKIERPPPGADSINFTATGGYVAFSQDASLLEEYIRSGENTGKSLRELAGLNEAVQKIGGMENGLFTFENQAESLRTAFEVMKNDPEGYRSLLFFGVTRGPAPGEENRLSRWFNVKLLPAYDTISKYFGIAVISGTTTADGIYVRGFAPTPPRLRQ